jgi:hypothetical protein
VAAAKREEDEKKRPEVRRLPSGRARRGDSSRAPTQGLAGPFVISHFSDSDNVLKRNGTQRADRVEKERKKKEK